MLETRNLPISPRTRRLDAPPRAASPRVSSSAAKSRSQVNGNAALERALPAPRPVVRPPAPARQSRLGRSEMRLMGAATTCTAVVCGLLLLYLAAYAHVTQLGIDQSQARAQLRDNRLQNEMLRAERDRLQSPQRVIAAAVALGMTPREGTPIAYVAPPPRAEPNRAAGQDGSREASGTRGREQGTNGGTTADSASTSFHY